MSGDSVAELLADLIDPARYARPAPAPAKAANPANHQQARGLPADAAACEDLRIYAKAEQRAPGVNSDSQSFAAVRSGADGPQSEQWRRSSHDSQDSQGSPGAMHSKCCADCRHLLRHGTCADPVAAGLLPEFGIVWPPEALADTCAAFSGKAPGKPMQRAYRLTAAEADRCHAPAWKDAEIACFSARVQRFARLAIDPEDADDLAERLTLRDREGDKRVMCAECSHYRTGRCGNHGAAGLESAELGRDMAALLQHCPGFNEARG